VVFSVFTLSLHANTYIYDHTAGARGNPLTAITFQGRVSEARASFSAQSQQRCAGHNVDAITANNAPALYGAQPFSCLPRQPAHVHIFILPSCIVCRAALAPREKEEKESSCSTCAHNTIVPDYLRRSFVGQNTILCNFNAA
jgi:hypothetical protein